MTQTLMNPDVRPLKMKEPKRSLRLKKFPSLCKMRPQRTSRPERQERIHTRNGRSKRPSTKMKKAKPGAGPLWNKPVEPNFAVFETAADLTLGEGAKLKIVMAQNLDNPGHNIGCFRLSVATSPRPIKAS
ncbi:MAG: hypothetical protein V9G29_00235 [Burkholderiaceae bacterium]